MIAFELPHSPTDTINAQIVMFGDDVGCPLVRTDYHLAAEGFGGEGMILNDPKATGKTLKILKEAQQKALNGTAVCVNAHIGKTDFRKGSISV